MFITFCKEKVRWRKFVINFDSGILWNEKQEPLYHLVPGLKLKIMKLKGFSLVFLAILSSGLSAQTVMDVARSKSITWYGIDFSKARFIGFESYITPEMLKDELIKNWADHTAQTNFSSKYSIDNVAVETSTADEHNADIDKTKLLTNAYYELNTATITDLVSGYKTSGTGFGFVFIVESFEKSTEKVFIYVCYFKESDRGIISMRRYTGKAFGIGLENHYEGAIKDVIQYSSKDFKRFSKK